MKRLLLLVMILIVAALLITPSVALAGGGGPPPPPQPGSPTTTWNITPVVILNDNPDCGDYGTCGSNELKIQPPDSGTYTDTNGTYPATVTITRNGDYFDWESNQPVAAVIVKGGANSASNIYYYDPNQKLDTGLHAPCNLVGSVLVPYGISHIIFCYYDDNPPVPEASSIILLSLGLLVVGGFVWYGVNRRRATA